MNTNAFQEFEDNAEYVKFWPRTGAYLLDGIFVGVIIGIIGILNMYQFRSFSIYFILTLLSALYKPFFEFKYGATLGKMVLKIKVVDSSFNKISFKQSLIRSAILIIPSFLQIPIYYMAFNDPNVINAEGFLGFSQVLAVEYPLASWIGHLTSLILIIEIIVLLSDSTKTQRTLHDQIAKTYVIYE